jgi:hypothetical protein
MSQEGAPVRGQEEGCGQLRLRNAFMRPQPLGAPQLMILYGIPTARLTDN